MTGAMRLTEGTVGRSSFAGLFSVTLATLAFEILLTRIFSVTMWYHFAFMAISIAMFGMTLGALVVFLFPNRFTSERAHRQLAVNSLLFSVTIILSIWIHLQLPFPERASPIGILVMAIHFVAIAVPFVFSGIAVCLALTRFPAQLSGLYAADLFGAGVGCVAIIYLLRVTDGPTAVVFVGAIAAFGALLFASDAGLKPLALGSFSICLLMTLAAGVHTVLVNQQRPVFRLVYVKGAAEPPLLYERWNSFSRIRVHSEEISTPWGWGMSSTLPSDQPVIQLKLDIDGTAGTMMTQWDGSSANEHLRYDITNLVHFIRPDAKVLVVGAGGGRDVLSALEFDQREVVAVEINEDIIRIVNEEFGDFTGHLDQDPRVTFVNDEARSHLARRQDEFDIIQISLIDTWAATAAGAFVLSENSLYTTEAWQMFLERLSPRGILTVSRWYFEDRPGEMYRVAALARSALASMGIPDASNHVMIARNLAPNPVYYTPDGVGTILVSKQPFSETDLSRLSAVAERFEFELAFAGGKSLDPVFDTLLVEPDYQSFSRDYPINIAPPTDDSPFFFNMLRFQDIFDRSQWQQGVMTFNMKAVFILGILLLTVLGLTSLCIVLPLLIKGGLGSLRGGSGYLLFFASIGMGFMLIEISQMQRLIVFLGHPIYGLSVVLFSLLLSSGLGSLTTQRIKDAKLYRSGLTRLVVLLLVLIVFATVTPYMIGRFAGQTTPVRIALATTVLAALGFFMGMAFPLGMRRASGVAPELTPWLWGVNGATSVCASVIAIVIALAAGISAAYWTGVVFYGIAGVAYAFTSRVGQRNATSLPAARYE